MDLKIDFCQTGRVTHRSQLIRPPLNRLNFDPSVSWLLILLLVQALHSFPQLYTESSVLSGRYHRHKHQMPSHTHPSSECANQHSQSVHNQHWEEPKADLSSINPSPDLRRYVTILQPAKHCILILSSAPSIRKSNAQLLLLNNNIAKNSGITKNK